MSILRKLRREFSVYTLGNLPYSMKEIRITRFQQEIAAGLIMEA